MRLLQILIWSVVVALAVAAVRIWAAEGVLAAYGLAKAGLVLAAVGVAVDVLRKLVSR